jgi:putative DNA primase/helicase
MRRQRSYARAALESEVQAVAATPPGQRNVRLNRAAFAIGQIIGTHPAALVQSEVEAQLLLASTTAGLTELEARATISYGLTAGIANPRDAARWDAGHEARVNRELPIAREESRPSAAESSADDSNRRLASALWHTARPAEGTLAEIYLRSRGFEGIVPDALRWHDGTSMPDGGRYPCLIAAVTIPTSGELLAVQRTALRPDGAAKAAISRNKASLGSTRGGAVVLGDLMAGDAILEGEGVETVLSARSVLDWPAIATLSCEALGQVPLPEARPVVILVDRGGEAKARAGAQRRHAEGRAVRLAYVPGDLRSGAHGIHANDVLRERGPDAVRAMVTAAETYRPMAVAPAPLPAGFARRADGTILYEMIDEEGEARWAELCTPLELLAATRDADGQHWGLLIRAQNPDGRWSELAMPMEWLAGDGRELRAALLNLGVRIANGAEPRRRLAQLFASPAPKARALCVGRLGWQDRAFVLPDAVFGEAAGQRTVWQPHSRISHAYRTTGTLDGWRTLVAGPAAGNSRLVLALAIAFAAPLLELLGLEGGGFHVRGPSSTGKTTLLRVAGSVWGGGGLDGYARRWRTTANGLEGVASLHCDSLLCLDELAETEGRDAYRAAYMLANGQGKQRAGLAGEARQPQTWRLLFLSTGELSLAEKVAEDGRRATAGQEVRVIDIAADAGAGLGLFESLHGAPDPDAFARRLRDGTGAHYGHPVRAYLKALGDDLDGAVGKARQYLHAFEEKQRPANACGQVRRVLARFAIAAAGGELAAHFGIVPWMPGEASRGAARCWSDWLAARGGVGEHEAIQAIAQVRAFLEAHGSSRFAPLEDADRPLANRVGYYARHPDGSRTYYVLPEVWRTEVCRGREPEYVARLLAERGVLQHDPRTWQARVRIAGQRRRVYAIAGALHDLSCPSGPACPGVENRGHDEELVP